MPKRDNRSRNESSSSGSREPARQQPRKRPKRAGAAGADSGATAPIKSVRAPGGKRKPGTRPPARGGRTAPKRSRKPRPGSRRWRPALRRIALVAGLVALGLFIAAGVVWASVYRSLPDPSAQAKGRDQTTRVLDRRGKLIAEIYAEQNRTDVPLADMPVALRQAVVATEDQRFYAHKGVDPLGIARAALVDIAQGSKAQGGSTITQQYVKNAFITPERTFRRKLKEAALAYRVEKTYTKDRILESYLNTIYFGHGAYGVESASRAYFGKSVKHLSLPECALLAGVIRSPGRYSSYIDPEAAVARRDHVLGRLRSEGYIDAAAHDAAKAVPVKTAGLRARTGVAPHFIEYVKAQLTEAYGSEAVFRGGLIVRTTLDLEMQKAAEQAIAKVLGKEGDPAAALVAVDPTTGGILAMVGGRDFADQQFNLAVQGRRQPGSAFKPFVLAAALEKGILPEETFESGPVTLKVAGSAKPWKVTGAGGGRKGPMRLREATEKSVNSVYAQLIVDIGPSEVVDLARRMGVTDPITPVPAIALGGHEQGVSPLQMASAYATLANAGEYMTPYAVSRVEDTDRTVIDKTSPERTQAVQPAVAYLITDVLRGVISRGTGRAAAIGRPAAGKTGTTQRYRDAWFVGYTPALAAAVWVGYPDEQREMTDVRGERVTGGTIPAEIWRGFMRAALADTTSANFVRPKGLTTVKTCATTGLRATLYCPNTFSGLYLVGRTPGSCDTHTYPLSIVVPDLAGLTKEAALAQLDDLLLGARVVERASASIAAGIVVRQTPEKGSVGDTSTVVTLVVSTGPAADRPPVAAFSSSAGPVSGGAAVVSLDASASSDDKALVRYVWEFGDGSPRAEGKTVSHTFAPGTYEVTLWVTDSGGQVSSLTHTVEVN